MKISLDTAVLDQIDNLKKYDTLYKNELSHFINNTFREKIFNLKSYISGEKQKDELLYLSVNITAMIVRSFADFSYGDGIKIKTDDKNFLEMLDYNNFEDLVYNGYINQSKNGYSIFRIRREDENIKIENIPYNYYIPNISNLALGQEPTEHNIVSNVVDENGDTVAYIQQYKLENGKWHYIYGKGEPGNEIVIKEILAEEMLDFLPLVVVNNHKLDDYFGKSDLEDILDLLEEINDRMTQISVQFIKHLNSKLAVSEGFLQWASGKIEDGSINSINELEVLGIGQGEQAPTYVENKNLMIKDSMDYIDRVLRLISSIVQVPTSFLGLEENGGAEKVEALKIKLMRFIKKVDRKQKQMKNGIKELYTKYCKLENKTPQSIEIVFSKGLPDSLRETAETYIELYNTGLVSKETAISNIFKYDNDLLQEELDKINQEDVVNKTITTQSLFSK